ncbi:MAG: GGDEF domain-containing protein [Actinobacteria bacterium]|nr:GGDEF domain-containing protein [Actinomycetota bacterium]
MSPTAVEPEPAAPSPGERWRQLLPFLLAVIVAFALAALPPHEPGQVRWLALAALAFALTATTIMAVPWGRLGDGWPLLPVLAFCAGVAALRESAGGGATAGYAPLLMLPVVWQALYGRRHELNLTIVAVGATLAAPILLVGGPRYPLAQWRLVGLFGVTATVVGGVIFRLVTERARLLEEVRAQAGRDTLTGLPNRRSWDDELPRAVAVAAREGRPLSVALIDLDHFKAYNDQHGHGAGDALLEQAARSWSQALRQGDVLARWGGEEFALLLPGAGGAAAAQVIERLQRATPGGRTFSAGVTTERFQPNVPADPARIMESVDVALYAAKHRGRARIVTVQDLEGDVRAQQVTGPAVAATTRSSPTRSSPQPASGPSIRSAPERGLRLGGSGLTPSR